MARIERSALLLSSSRKAKREGKPKYKADNLNSDYIVESVIPACKDAKSDEGCY